MLDRHEIAAIFEEIATFLELQGENPFKIQAYRTAARQLENLTEDLHTIVIEERLSEIQGIGKALAEKITELHTTGQLSLYNKLKKEVPKGLQEMLEIPGLGSKKIKTLYETLKISTITKLKNACEQGKVAKLSGFGATTEENILNGIAHLEIYKKRHLWWSATQLAEPILEGLRRLKEVQKAEIAGSLRRKLETVHDIDLLVASSKPDAVMQWFTTQNFVAHVAAKGSTKSSIRLQEGLQADLRVVSLEQFPFALHYFIGSKAHNIKIRQRAHTYGFKLSEWGFEPLDPKIGVPKVNSEKQLYRSLDLAYIEPELREERGEIEAAETSNLPKLVEEKDLRGAFHNHTTASDGHNTLEEMAEAAENLGWEYLGIADHSKSSVQANGLSEERLIEQIKQIKKLNRSKKYQTHIFAGIECDVMRDGTLDFEDEVLQALDYVVISIHSSFKMDERAMTKRLIRAIENPYSTMVGHLTGRLLLKREPYALNISKVIDACIANGVIIEINANPRRLDMDWRLWHAAKGKGLMACINPDAHSTEMLEFVKAGINCARKGWLEKEDILNTHTLAQVKKYLK